MLTVTYDPMTRLGTGGTAEAYPTIREALQGVDSGGTVYVRGTHVGYETTGAAAHCFRISKPCTLTAYDADDEALISYDPNQPPIRDLATGDCGPIIIVASDNVTIDGKWKLHIGGTRPLSRGRGGDGDVSIHLESGLRNITIRRCILEDAGHGAIKGTGAFPNLLVEENIIYAYGADPHDHAAYFSVGGASATERATFRGNWIFDSRGGRGLNFYYEDAQYVDAYANVIWDTVGGIQLVGRECRLYNNHIIRTRGYYGWGYPGEGKIGGLHLVHASCRDNEICNNLLYGNENADITLDNTSALASSLISHNAWQTIIDVHNEWTGVNDMHDAPEFVTETPQSCLDTRLAPGSPLLTAGTDSPFGELLDPTSPDFPRLKPVEGQLPIGAWAAL